MDFNSTDYGHRKMDMPFLDEWNNKSKSEKEKSIGINWSKKQEVDFEEGEEIIVINDKEEVAESDVISLDDVLIGNRKLNLTKFQSKERGEQTEKLTIYLSRNLIITLKLLKKNKSIQSYSQCISDALIQYFTT